MRLGETVRKVEREARSVGRRGWPWERRRDAKCHAIEEEDGGVLWIGMRDPMGERERERERERGVCVCVAEMEEDERGGKE